MRQQLQTPGQRQQPRCARNTPRMPRRARQTHMP